MAPFRSLLRFPLWKFLKQPVFKPSYKTILNPHHFWIIHQVDLLERCLRKDFPARDVHRD